jgi:hypothetical protein
MRCRRDLGVVLIAVGVSACAATTFTSTWKDAGVRGGELQDKRVAALVRGASELSRRRAEDALAGALASHGVAAVPGYRVLGEAASGDVRGVRDRLRAAGVEGAVVMRVIGTRQEVTVDGPYISRHDARQYPYMNDRSYLWTDEIVIVETLVYDAGRDRILWVGVSETVDPRGMDAMAREIVAKASRHMKEQALLMSRK